MARRTKIITEYRWTGGDADGENMVRMETALVGTKTVVKGDGNKMVGMGTKYFTCHPLKLPNVLTVILQSEPQRLQQMPENSFSDIRIPSSVS